MQSVKPDPAAGAHPLQALLRQCMAMEGPLTFMEFMRQALYHPEYGYYGSGRALIGRRGDFITSVSVGPLFGRLLARQWAEMWVRLGSPARCTLAEEGAHAGTLAADILTALAQQDPACAAATHYLLVEPNLAWAERQRATLQRMPRVSWRAAWDEVEPFEGAHLSNELLVAFPVHAVAWQGGWQERYVTSDYTWQLGPLSSPALAARLATLPTPYPEGYCTEVNTALEPWLERVSQRLTRGWMLVIDYGYEAADLYRPERVQGTLSAYRRQQRVADPLQDPGEVDLTSHVDFTAVEQAAATHGWQPAGFTDQQRFLTRLASLHFQDTAQVFPALAQEMRQFRTLSHPELMGAAFKVLGLMRGVEEDAPLTGFKGVE